MASTSVDCDKVKQLSVRRHLPGRNMSKSDSCQCNPQSGGRTAAVNSQMRQRPTIEMVGRGKVADHEKRLQWFARRYILQA